MMWKLQCQIAEQKMRLVIRRRNGWLQEQTCLTIVSDAKACGVSGCSRAIDNEIDHHTEPTQKGVSMQNW